MELYTVMTSVVGDHTLSFFRESTFGSGKEPLEESHESFVHNLSQSTAAIGLTILKAAVKVKQPAFTHTAKTSQKLFWPRLSASLARRPTHLKAMTTMAACKALIKPQMTMFVRHTFLTHICAEHQSMTLVSCADPSKWLGGDARGSWL